MITRFFGADRIRLVYQPFAELPRINPLLQAEIERFTRLGHAKELPLFGAALWMPGCVFQAFASFVSCAALMVWMFRAPRMDLSLALLPILAVTIVSITVDLLVAVRVINQLQERQQQGNTDPVRFAMLDDSEYVHTFEAVSIVKGWSLFQREMMLRAFPALVAGFIGTAMAVGAISNFVGWLIREYATHAPSVTGYVPFGSNPFLQLEMLMLGVLALCLSINYVSAALPRLRFVASFASLCALRSRDRGTAILYAVTGVLSARLLLLLIAATLGSITFSLRIDTFSFELSQMALTVRYFAWLAVLLVLLPHAIHWLFGALHHRVERLTLRAIQSGD